MSVTLLLKGGYKNVLFFILCLICAIPFSVLAVDPPYYSTWELQSSGKYRLVWYYATKADLDRNQPNKVLVQNKEFLIRSDVRPPTINGVYLLEYAKVNEGEEVLDIGTGSGVHAIFAAENAKHVVATDIFEPAIENAKINAQLNGVSEKIDFRTGDLFEPIKDGEKFDVFFVNINFPFNNDDKERKKLHERLFAEVRKYMKPHARIYYQTSYIKTIPYIIDMLTRQHFRIMEMHTTHMLPYHHEPVFIMVQSF